MKSFLIVGMTGTGKTTEVKNLLNKFSAEKKIYDVNNEYLEFTKNSGLPSMEKFLSDAEKITNSVIVFEEATIFFNKRGYDDRLVNLLVRKRHTKNIIIFVFHSLRSIPTYIFELIDFFAIKKTNDTIDRIKQFKSPELMRIFETIEKSSNLEPYKTIWVKGADL